METLQAQVATEASATSNSDVKAVLDTLAVAIAANADIVPVAKTNLEQAGTTTQAMVASPAENENQIANAVVTPSNKPSTTPLPSPPPTDLTNRRIVEQMNQFYSVSRNVVQSQQGRNDLREDIEKVFDNARDIEDILINSHVELVNANDRSSRRRLPEVESEDYYDDLPDIITQDTEDPLKCKCVDCGEDEICGGLWKGKRYPGDYDLKTKKIHIVVSHCMNDLDWIPGFTKGYDVKSIHVISKCENPVKGAPEAATIEVLPNI